MELIEKIIDGVKFTFVNDAGSNRSGFYHDTTLLQNGREIGRNRSQYYNRTWESYKYQSCMKTTVHNTIKKELLEDFESYKKMHGVSRLSQKVKDEIEAADTTIKTLRKLYETL